MKVRATDYLLTNEGIAEREQEHELSTHGHCMVYCDVLSINDRSEILSQEENQPLATLIERWIIESLTKDPETDISESSLSKAFD